jgi:hypothetical protein
MPGYAYPVGATTAEYPSRTINTTASTQTIFDYTYAGSIIGYGFTYPTSVKIRVNSMYVTNISGGILPIKIIRGQVDGMGVYEVVHTSRIKKGKFIALPLVSGDSRTSGDADGEAIMTEFVLAPGDFLAAICPIEDSLVVTTNVSIGVK